MTDLKPTPEPSHSDSPAIPGIEQRVLYHGTSRQAARRIIQEGLRDWT